MSAASKAASSACQQLVKQLVAPLTTDDLRAPYVCVLTSVVY